MEINDKGLQIIMDSEGLYFTEYKCPAGYRTIGYGHVMTLNDVFDQPITKEFAIELLKKDCKIAESCVNSNVDVPLTPNQFSALVSLTFNIGCGNFKKSALLKVLNKSMYQAAAMEILKHNKARVKGVLKELPGLTKRRKKEYDLFMEV